MDPSRFGVYGLLVAEYRLEATFFNLLSENCYAEHMAPCGCLRLSVVLHSPGSTPKPACKLSIEACKPQPILCPCFLLWPSWGSLSFEEVYLGGKMKRALTEKGIWV